MRKATRAPAYAVIYHGLAEVARKYGYALAIHGSVLTDLDLVAIPWTDNAVDAETVKRAIVKHIGLCGINTDENGNDWDIPFAKPHGRVAWKFHLEAGGAVDLSVMPRMETLHD